MTDNSEWPTITYWKMKYDESQQVNLALRRDNERLTMKVAELSSTLTELRRDLYWHVERMERTIHP